METGPRRALPIHPLYPQSPVWDAAEPAASGLSSAKLLTGDSPFSLKTKKFFDPNFSSCYQPFQREPDFHVTSVNYSVPELLARAEPPR